MGSRSLRARNVLALASVALLAACAARNRATGSVAGQSFDGTIVEAKYCAHCAGGELVVVAFKPPERDATFVLETEYCSPRGLDSKLSASGEARAYLYSQRDKNESPAVVEGELSIKECRRDFLRASFRAKFADGSELSGDVATPLAFDAGYD